MKNVYLVLGGFHLSGASDSELKIIINDFKNQVFKKLLPAIALAIDAENCLKQEYKENFIENGVGKIIEI